MRIGHGYDVHRLTEGRRLILGGAEIFWEKGLRNGSGRCPACRGPVKGFRVSGERQKRMEKPAH